MLPAGYTLRASGGLASGYLNDSFCLAQAYIGKPVIISQPVDRTNYVGASGSLAIHAEGTQPLSYQWLRNGVEIPAKTNNMIAFPSVQPGDTGNYSVVVSNQFGSVISTQAAVTVLSPPRILVNDGNLGFTNGQFGFNIAGPAGQTIVVEWSGTFVIWLPLQTNLLGTGPYHFSEPRSTKYPFRFYRVRVTQ